MSLATAHPSRSQRARLHPADGAAATYALGESDAEAERLRVLDAVYGHSSRALLASTGLTAGWRCLDIGCGTGHIALWLAERVARTGHVTGVDRAELFVNLARTNARQRNLDHAHFIKADASAAALPNASFDLVYSRCLLSHLSDPLAVLRRMTALAKPGGIVVVEDIDCGGGFTHPESPAQMRHLDLYQAIVRHHGGDPLLGRKLPRLFRAAGLTEIHFEIVTPTEPALEVKRLYPLTLAGLKPAIIQAGLATAAEVDAIVAELHALANAPEKTASSCPLVQVRARKAA